MNRQRNNKKDIKKLQTQKNYQLNDLSLRKYQEYKEYDGYERKDENQEDQKEERMSQNFENDEEYNQQQQQENQDQVWNEQQKQQNQNDDEEGQNSELSENYEKNHQNYTQEDQDQQQFPMKLPFPVTSGELTKSNQNNTLNKNKNNRQNAYELTFKKELNHFQNNDQNNFISTQSEKEEYHRSNQISMMNKKLFKSIKPQNLSQKSQNKQKSKNSQNELQHQLSQLPSDLESLLTQPLQYFYKMPIEQLQNLPFFQMQSCILSISQAIKKNIIGQILQVKRLKIKLHSAQINHNILLQKRQKNIQQKHKEYLLSLLKLQLHKKIFIQCLRLNAMQNQLLKSQLQQKKQRQKQKQKQKKDQVNSSKAKNKCKAQSKNNISKNKNANNTNELKQQESEDFEHQNYQNSNFLEDSFEIQQKKAKITIFMQILHTIFSRKTYITFHALVDYQKNTKKIIAKEKSKKNVQKKSFRQQQNIQNYFYEQNDTPSKLNERNSKQNQLQKYLKKRESEKQSNTKTNKHQHAQEQQQISNYQHSQRSNKLQNQSNNQQQQESLSDQQKMNELLVIIQQLQQQLQKTNPNHMLKIYFLKWKIFYLNSILQEFQQNDQWQQQGEQQQKQNEQQFQEKSLNEQEFQQHENEQSFQSVATSGIYSSIIQSSQILAKKNENEQDSDSDRSLKRQKKYLKYFLFREQVFNFFDLFKEKVASNKLKKICKMLYEENLLKRALRGFSQNIQTKKNYQQMEVYYQDIANQQIQDDTTYDMFHKTTIIARNFFNLKNTWKTCKLLRLLDKTTLKIFFIKIANFSNSQKKKLFNIQRFIQISNSKQKFRAFQGWKQKTILDQIVTKAKRFRRQKDFQIVKHYFSIFQLFYKKNLIQQKKAIKHHKQKNISKTFEYLKFLSKQNRELNQKAQELKENLAFKKGRIFMRNLTDYYTESLLYQRIKIKQRKLQTNLDKSFIIQRLKSWQTLTIKKQSYKAIQYRLIRLRQKQVKGNVLKIWYDQLLKAQQRKGEMDQSSQHKDWLVKYYGDLCSMVKL